MSVDSGGGFGEGLDQVEGFRVVVGACVEVNGEERERRRVQCLVRLGFGVERGDERMR